MQRRIPEEPRQNDWRSPFSRDKARIIHSAGFRRLQGKTQVMGAGENDFHRTRLTHSLEVNQIGVGLFKGLNRLHIPKSLEPFIKDAEDVISAACHGHDLGHPAFGHGGERALHFKMKEHGGFEGNAQTIRLLTKLENYHENHGINPTRRVILSLLKYPVNFNDYPESAQKDNKPPKCYYKSEKEVIEWCLEPFHQNDRDNFVRLKEYKPGAYKPEYMSFDASIMECADDIAYCSHDLEDIVARGLVSQNKLLEKVKTFFNDNKYLKEIEGCLTIEDFNILYAGSCQRKKIIGKIVNLLMTNTEIVENESFDHPLMRYRLSISKKFEGLIDFLKTEVTYKMVVEKPEIQMLEIKGQRIVKALFDELTLNPQKLIPHWDSIDKINSKERRVCDYLAGMTDSFAIKIYHRLFTPGIGSSRDEM